MSNTPYDGGRWVTDGGWCVTDGGWCGTDGGWCVTDGGWCVTDGGWWVTDGGWWVTDGGWWVTDGGWWVTDGGWCVTDGGWCVTDGGWWVTDGGWWVATKHQRVAALVKKKKKRLSVRMATPGSAPHNRENAKRALSMTSRLTLPTSPPFLATTRDEGREDREVARAERFGRSSCHFGLWLSSPAPPDRRWESVCRGSRAPLRTSPNSSVTVIPTCPSQHPFRLAGSQTP